MKIVNTVLHLATFGMLITLIHQFLFSKNKGGDVKHVFFGKLAVLFEIIIAITVTIRGMHQERFTTLYIMHLVVGGAFFLAVSLTAFFGFRSLKKASYGYTHHRLFAKLTLGVFILTVLLGIFSKFLSKYLT